MEEFLAKLVELGTSVGLKLLYAVVVLVVGLKLVGFVGRKVAKSRFVQKHDSTLSGFVRDFVTIVLKIVVIISAAIIVGIPAATFITVLGSCGVAIGLALQGALGNLAGGLMILFFKPFQVGDYIDCASGGGTVQRITVFYTILITPDNREITVPNGSLTGSAITNYSRCETRRQDFTFNVAATNDIDRVKRVILEASETCKGVLREPVPAVWLSENRAPVMGVSLRVWTKNQDYWDVNMAMQELVKRALDEAGVEVPVTKYELSLREKP